MAGNVSELSRTLTVTIEAPTVVGRYVYYPDSDWEGAFAPDKEALRTDFEAVTATSANVTNHPDGIRGIYIDVTDLPAVPTSGDFTFRTGNSEEPAEWQLLATPPEITVIEDGGINDSDGYHTTWPAHTIENTWLQVTVKWGANTGLAEDDVFYFGNRVGDVGDEDSPGMVTAADLVAIRNHPRD